MKSKIIKNSIYNVVYKVFSVLFPLVTTSYISRVLLAEGVGKVAYSQTIVTYFITLASLGIPQYGIKAIAQSGSNKKNRSKSFLELYLINFISTVICIVAYYLAINFIPFFDDKKALFNVMGLLLILNLFNVDWFYQGVEEYSYIATRSIIIKVLSLALMFLLVKSKEDYIIYGFILCLATAGNYLLNVFNLRKHITLKVDHLQLKTHIKPIFILLASAVATEIYTMLDTVMIEHFHDDECVGYYSNAVKIIRILYTLVIAVVATFYPQISKFLKDENYIESNRLLSVGIKIIIMIALPMALGLFIMAPDLVTLLLGEGFTESILTLRIMSILIIVFSFAYYLGHIILISTGNEKKILFATLLGAGSNFILNLMLIPQLRHNGAAVASVIAEVIVTFSLILNSKKYFSLDISKKYVISVLSATVLMGVAVSLNQIFISNIIIKSVSGVFVGVIIYFCILYVTKNEIIKTFTDLFMKKIRR